MTQATLLLAEHDNSELAPSTYATVTAAVAMGGAIDILVAGDGCAGVASTAAAIPGIRRVQLAEAEALRHPLAEQLAALVLDLAPEYTHLVAPATTFGKNVLPRIAALLDSQQVSDIVAVESHDTFIRPIYAGNALATVRSTDGKKVITVRPTAFERADSHGGEAAITAIDVPELPPLSTFVDEDLNQSDRPQLDSARIVVSGGRGLGSGENFRIIEELADLLNGAVGASRAAVDAGYVPNDYQVGQTGKVVAPDLYIAVGISGAIQHLAGMAGSKVIVAINKDEEAPIFEVADYGLVGDLFTIVPELVEAIRASR